MKSFIKNIFLAFLILSLIAPFGMVPKIVHAAGFSYYRTITVNHTLVGSTDSTNFPVLVSGTYTYLKTVGNGGKVQNANGYDVGFYTSSDCSTGKMKWETEKYTASTGEVVYWVKVATLSHISDTVFYMCYGNSSISTDQSDAANTWDTNFTYVGHLADGTTLNGNDSTGNGNGTLDSNPPTATAGKIGGGGSFAGGQSSAVDGGGITVADRDTLSVSSAAAGLTLSGWVNRSSASTGSFVHKYDVVVDTEYIMGFLNNDFYAWILDSTSGGGSGAYFGRIATGVGTTNQWDYYTFTWQDTNGARERTDFKIYRNGIQVDDTDFDGGFPTQPRNTIMPFKIGGYSSGLGSAVPGKYDEIHFSQAVRSADWILAEYNNQSDPTSFYTVGAETATGGSTSTTRLRIMAGKLRIIGKKLIFY